MIDEEVMKEADSPAAEKAPNLVLLLTETEGTFYLGEEGPTPDIEEAITFFSVQDAQDYAYLRYVENDYNVVDLDTGEVYSRVI